MKNILRVAAMMLLASVCSFGQTLMGQWTFNSSSGPTPAIRIDQGQFAGFQYLQLIFTPQGSSSTCSLTVDTSSNGSSGPFTTGGGVSSQSCLAAGSALSAALGTNVTSIQVNPTLAGGGTVYVQLLGGVAAFGGTGTKPSSPCGDSSHALGWTGSAYNCQGITGSASAGGSNLQIQWNNSTALGGISGFTTNGTTTINGGASSVFDMHLGTSVFLPGSLSTGILKVTTSTGALSDAAGSDVASLLSASLPLSLSGSGVFACAGCGQTGNPLSQFASTTSAQLRGVLSDPTGTGSAVFGTSPTLVTPALGTPSALILTNATGLPNAGLLNPATTVNGQPCTLGSTCTIPFSTNSSVNTSQAGINLLTSTANAVGLTVTPTNSATNQEKFEITGGSYTGNAATATNATEVGGITVTGTPSVGYVPTATSGSAATWQAQSGGGPALGSAAQVPVMNSGALAYAPVTLGGDFSITSLGAGTVNKLQGNTLTLSTPAQSQVTVFNSSGVLVNGYSGITVDAQTGNYTYSNSTCPTDRLGEVEFNISAAATLTVPQAGSTACLGNNNAFVVRNTPSSTAVLTVSLTTSTFQPESGSTHTLLPNSALFVYSDATSGTGNYHAIIVPVGLAGVSTKTSAYTANAGDAGKLIVMNCSSACALTLPSAPPSAIWDVDGILSIGSTLATVSLNGLNLNGAGIAPTLSTGHVLKCCNTDGVNYFGDLSSSGSALPTASAAGQLPNSTGAGTTYAAQTKPIVDVRDYEQTGSTLCDYINNASTANPFAILDARGFQSGTYACLNVNLPATTTSNGGNTILFNGQTILTTSVGFNLDNRERLEGNVGMLASTAAGSGFKIAADANFPLGSGGGVITVSGSNTSGSTTLVLAKAAGTSITLMPFDILAITGDTQLYTITPCTGGTGSGCTSTNGVAYSFTAGSTVTVNIAKYPTGSGGLAKTETNTTAVTLGHPVLELGSLQSVAGSNPSSPSSVQVVNAFVSCSASPSGVAIGVRDNYAQENSYAQNSYASDCPHGFMIVGHSGNSGPWLNDNVGYPNSGCGTGPDNGTAGSTVPIEVNGSHKQINRITVTSQPCTNEIYGDYLYDAPQGGGLTAVGGSLFTDLHGESATTGSDMIFLTAAAGPAYVSNISGCPSGNPCSNELHADSSFSGTLTALDMVGNNGTTNFIDDQVAGNTLTVAHNPNGLGFYFSDSTGAYPFTNANPAAGSDCVNCVNLYNGIAAGYASGTPTWRLTTSSGAALFGSVTDSALSTAGLVTTTSGGALGSEANATIAQGGTNATTAANALINLFPTASEVGDLVYCASFSSGCTSWAVLAGNTSGTKVLQETSVGAPSWVASGGVTTFSGTGIFTNASSVGAVTLTQSGTSGGIPYFSNTSTLASSALLAANAIVQGGGAGTAPTTGNADFTIDATAHTLKSDAGGIVDLSASTGAPSLKLPNVVGGTILAGTSTANLSAPIVIQNTNSSNNNTSITAIFSGLGTSTGETVLNVNCQTTGADCFDVGTGGTVTAGVLSGQTKVAQFLPTGSMILDGGNSITTGTGTSINLGACGTAPTGVSSTGMLYCNTDLQLHAMSGTTDEGAVANKSQTLQVTGANFVCNTGTPCTSATTITGLTYTFPLAAQNWSFDCNLIVDQATGATANTWSVQTATNGATNVTAAYVQNTAAATVASGATENTASTTTAIAIGGTWTLGATGTFMPVHIWGTIEGTSASGTVFNLQVTNPTSADALTIYRGSECRIF